MADAPGQPPVVQFNLVGWKRIRDPQTYPQDPPTRYGQASIPNGAALHSFGHEVDQMFADCYAAWGVPPPGPTHNTGQGCVRDVVVVAFLIPPCQDTICGSVILGGAYQSTCPDSSANPRCDYSNICNKTFNAQAAVGNDNAFTLAHELGHVLGLPHGDGTDDDCNGFWDEDCDNGETAEDSTNTNMNLMKNGGGTEPLTELQRDRVRTVALKSVPTAGTADLTKCAANEPVPPAPIAPDDNISPPPEPRDGGITGDGGSAPQPPPPTCGCELNAHGSQSVSALACLAALFWLSRRRRR